MSTHGAIAPPARRRDLLPPSDDTTTSAAAPELETERLRLRLFTPADLDPLARIFSHPEVMRYLGDGRPISRAASEAALTSIIAHWHRHGFGRWAVVHKAHGRLLGYGGLRRLDSMIELVYLLDRPYWGAGLATELARAVLCYGFRQRACDFIVAVTKPDNLASRRVLTKLGMRFEKEANYFNIPVVQYTITHAEHEENSRR